MNMGKTKILLSGTNLKMSEKDPCVIYLCHLKTRDPKRVLKQIVKTQMKCRTMLNFIRSYTVLCCTFHLCTSVYLLPTFILHLRMILHIICTLFSHLIKN